MNLAKKIPQRVTTIRSKRGRRVVLFIVILVTASFLFRGWLFRHLVTYKSVGLRQGYAAGSHVVQYIKATVDGSQARGIEAIIELTLSLTSKHLTFTTGRNEVDPNKLIFTRTAHCVGYATFFATTCNELLSARGIADEWIAKPHTGQLYFFGVNVHRYLDSPFFKDHDFVTIENKKTGLTFAVDPTVNDYLFIDLVNYEK